MISQKGGADGSFAALQLVLLLLGQTGWAPQGLSPERIATQKSVDEALTAALDKDVTGYLKHTFTLKGGDRPHLLKF